LEDWGRESEKGTDWQRASYAYAKLSLDREVEMDTETEPQKFTDS
jgi:hypothetical protein